MIIQYIIPFLFLVKSNAFCKLNKIFLILQPIKLNNTRKAQKEILFFNRVPKVGSQTTMELMRALALKNNFHYHKDRTQKVETIKLTNNEEVKSQVPDYNIFPKH